MIEASLVTTAGGELPFLREMIAIFAVGTAIVYVCHRLRLPPIVGFLLTGVLIDRSLWSPSLDLEWNWPSFSPTVW